MRTEVEMWLRSSRIKSVTFGQVCSLGGLTVVFGAAGFLSAFLVIFCSVKKVSAMRSRAFAVSKRTLTRCHDFWRGSFSFLTFTLGAVAVLGFVAFFTGFFLGFGGAFLADSLSLKEDLTCSENPCRI